MIDRFCDEYPVLDWYDMVLYHKIFGDISYYGYDEVFFI